MTSEKTDLKVIQEELDLLILRDEDQRRTRRLNLFKVLAFGLGFAALVTIFFLKPSGENELSNMSIKSKYQAKAKDYEFKWTLDDYDKINAHYEMQGDSLETILETYGKPSRVDSYDRENIYFEYEAPEMDGADGALLRARVNLVFDKRSDGYYLTNKSFNDFPLPETVELTTNPEGLDFSREAIDSLSIGSETGLGGESLTTILATYREPDQLTMSREKRTGRQVWAHYWTDYPEYSHVTLKFTEAANGEWLLVYEYSYFSSDN